MEMEATPRRSVASKALSAEDPIDSFAPFLFFFSEKDLDRRKATCACEASPQQTPVFQAATDNMQAIKAAYD